VEDEIRERGVDFFLIGYLTELFMGIEDTNSISGKLGYGFN
jgi:hypothetical protein